MKSIFTFLALLLVNISFTQSLILDNDFNNVGKAAMRTGGGISSAMAIQDDGKIIIGGRGGEGINNSGFCMVRFNTNGTIDTSFGNKGMAITVYGGSIQSIVILPGGKILAGGFLGSVLMARYLPDGKIDSSFGVNGLSRPSFQNIKYSYCYALKLQSDGKIVMTGSANGMFALTARFLSNGSFDSGFAHCGYTFLTSSAIAYDEAIQPDGKILIGGQGLNSNNFIIARYLSNGDIDKEFGNGGAVLTDMSDMNEFISSIALQRDGKIVAAGRYDYNNQFANNFKTALIRYNSNGSLDKSFGTNAISKFQFDDASADPKKIIIQNDGKIVVAGDYTDVYRFHKPTLIRFNNDGTIDNTFGNAGSIVTTSFGDSLTCKSAAVQPDGKIVIGGYQMARLDTSIIYYIDSFVVIRYDAASALPVTLLNFSASKQQLAVLLNWQTANEINNDYFSLERSAGNGFSEIGKLYSNNKNSYSYTDKQPLNGTNYYRLKQVDKDGKFTYSKTVSAAFDNANKYVVFPNPVINDINIKGLDANEKYHLTITDIKGHVVAEVITENNSAYKWHVENISKGFYYLSITPGNKTPTTLKFVKQ